MLSLNPNFKDLEKPEVFVNHIKELKASFNDEFPYHVFPKGIQSIINETHRCLKFPIPFISSSLMYACSVAIGGTRVAQILNGWKENAVVYLAIVGAAGSNKSHPLSFAIKPLLERDSLSFMEYEREKKEYDRVNSLSKKEKLTESNDELEKPHWKKFIVSDVTPEGLASILSQNRRGVGLCIDELAGWFNNFNRYSKGSEEEFWLSNWSGKPLCIERRTSEPIFINNPFVSVAGTIQNGVIRELATEKRSQNGFIDRMLFVIPENLKKEYWSEEELQPHVFENWKQIINNLLILESEVDESSNLKPIVLLYEHDAKQEFFKWQRENADECNATTNHSFKGILSKVETNAIRFSLMIHLMNEACGAPKSKYINKQSVLGAIELSKYFKNMSFKVIDNSKEDDLSNMSLDKEELFNALPDEFKTAEGLIVAKEKGVPERTFKDFLKNKRLFIREKQGYYVKIKNG